MRKGEAPAAVRSESVGGPYTPWFASFFRVATVAIFAVAAVFYVVTSMHWRMAVDTPVMHYVVFLMHHGLKPYTGITDNNMPGAYLTEAAAMAVFGGSDLSWRLYEYFLLGVFAVSAVVIARRWDWVAGVFAAGMFLVLHSAEGPQLAVERDLVIGVLLIAGCAVLFEAVDRRRPPLLLLFGLACGVACSIKPTFVVLPLALLLIAGVHLRRQGLASLRYGAWAFAGLAMAACFVLAFLSYFHAWQGFLFILLHVIPAYGGISRMRLGPLLAGLMPRAVLLVALLALPLLVHSVRRRTWDWQRWSLAVAAGFGLFSYVAQGKGSVYHRYVFLMFLLLLVGLEVFPALRQNGWPRWIAAATLCLAFATVPGHLRSAHAVVGQTAFELTLERDLQQLGDRQQLSGEVQCFDLVYGCLDALYHLRIVDTSGFTGDMLFFAPRITPPVLFYRDRFWQGAERHPAAVLVISNGLFAEPNSYAKLDRWPEFKGYLDSHYTLSIERSFPHERYTYHSQTSLPPSERDSYRLYLRNDSPLLAGARNLTPDPVSVGP